MGVKKITILKFIEGLDVQPISQGAVEAGAIKSYASEADFVTDKGSAAADGDIFRNSTTDIIMYYDGAWFPLFDDPPTVKNALVDTDSIVINLKKPGVQSFLVEGNVAACTLSNQPFGLAAPKDGALICLIGTSDAKTVTLNYSDTDYGLYMNMGTRTLEKGKTITFKWIQSLLRYVDIGANF